MPTRPVLETVLESLAAAQDQANRDLIRYADDPTELTEAILLAALANVAAAFQRCVDARALVSPGLTAGPVAPPAAFARIVEGEPELKALISGEPEET